MNSIEVKVHADPRRLTVALLALIVSGLGFALLQRGLLAGTLGGDVGAQAAFDLISWAPWLLLAPLAVVAARTWPVRSTPWFDVGRHAAFASAIAAAHAVIITGILRLLSGAAPATLSVMAIAAGLFAWRLALDVLVYGTIIGIVLAMDGEARANAYIVKPVAPERLREEALLPSTPLAFQDGGKALVFRAEELIWVEGAGDYARIHARGRAWLIRETLATIEARLQSPPFFRVHRSGIVNMWHVTMIKRVSRHRHAVVLRNGAEVAVSVPQRQRLEAWLDCREGEFVPTSKSLS